MNFCDSRFSYPFQMGDDYKFDLLKQNVNPSESLFVDDHDVHTKIIQDHAFEYLTSDTTGFGLYYNLLQQSDKAVEDDQVEAAAE